MTNFETFTHKFKDKIYYVKKHGWKETIESMNMEEGLSRVSTNQDNLMQQSRNRETSITSSNNHRKMLTVVDSSPNTRKSQWSNNQNKKNLLIRGRKNKKITLLTSEGSETGYDQRLYENKVTQNRSQQDNYAQMKEMKEINLSRNPEIELMAVKLREREREKFKCTQAPKYIDEMLIKHENLFKMYDTKKYKWKNKEEPSKREIEDRNSDIRYSDHGSRQEVVESRNVKLIRLKKIEDLIEQTNRNRLDQGSKTDKKMVQFLILNPSRRGNRELKKNYLKNSKLQPFNQAIVQLI